MGVGGLWSLLSPAAKQINLESCSGKRLAVDLSAWIVQCSSVATSKPIPASYLCCRGIFMRTLNLLSLGIHLVFVMDGPTPPAVKKKVKKREEFYHIAMEYKELLTAMGIPVLESVGEAEKLCAELNRRQLVDGVLTNDGDALIYGAQTVYKGLLQERKEQLAATVYDMNDVAAILSLTKRDLLAFALFSAGNFSDGVPNIREKKFEELIKEFKANNVTDALDRLLSWSTNTQLDSLNSQQKSLSGLKKRHCTKCLHQGSKQEHASMGCELCLAEFGCTKAVTTGHPSCSCDYHMVERAVQAYKTELKLRELALKSPSFPDLAMIEEFVQPLPQNLTDLDLSMRMPDFSAVCAFIEDRLHYPPTQIMSHLIPATIKMAFHGLLPDLPIQPLRIIRACTFNFDQCFIVRWKKLDQETLSDESSYNLKISQKLFASKYPEMAGSYMSPIKSAVKRPHPKMKQTKITSVYKTVKTASQLSQKP